MTDKIDPSNTDYTGGLDSYLVNISESFFAGVGSLGAAMDVALKKLTESPSDPSALAGYQAILSEYNLYRNAQTSSVKAMKDIDSSIVSNFR